VLALTSISKVLVAAGWFLINPDFCELLTAIEQFNRAGVRACVVCRIQNLVCSSMAYAWTTGANARNLENQVSARTEIFLLTQYGL